MREREILSLLSPSSSSIVLPAYCRNKFYSSTCGPLFPQINGLYPTFSPYYHQTSCSGASRVRGPIRIYLVHSMTEEMSPNGRGYAQPVWEAWIQSVTAYPRQALPDCGEWPLFKKKFFFRSTHYPRWREESSFLLQNDNFHFIFPILRLLINSKLYNLVHKRIW